MVLSSAGISAVIMISGAEAGILRLWFVDLILIVVTVAIADRRPSQEAGAEPRDQASPGGTGPGA